MKKLFAVLSVVLAFPLFANSFKVDPAASKVEWIGKKVTGQHNGTLAMKGGKLEFKGDDLVGGEFSVDMTSLKVLDLTDPGYNKDLTTHLKSDDFFSAEKHPEAKFVVKSATKKADGTYEVKGPMTIKGISQEVTIPLKIEKKGDMVEATGKASLDRTKWQIKFRSGRFFPNLGDKLIHDNFEIAVDVKAKKA